MSGNVYQEIPKLAFTLASPTVSFVTEPTDTIIMIGSLDDAFNDELKAKFNIKTYINLADEIPVCERLYATGYKLGVKDDDHDENITRILKDAFLILNDAIQKGENVMIHCLEGISRSAAVLTAFIAHSKSINLQRARQLLLDVHPIVDIYPRYWDQLLSSFAQDDSII